ncbi:hypothetical protein VIBNISO65_250127 [Vibrio nigripulchritudo SO65]|nr:hypothetical protein VIBNIAM115_170029 [Vibrio nigripulchritudo AM115]CCN40756.1 hypothetical protein VIBNIFTn2_1370126 [Vibrio nigripulchritudo FTn2]CCN64435.1 hypothetical protein VIBNIPon4_220037 [Vibrio nigripulchritudo POn4]CCN77456.1 hypothetical protein VIBNISO65_250127 [Vibrio nigripulchritudo SO65]
MQVSILRKVMETFSCDVTIWSYGHIEWSIVIGKFGWFRGGDARAD